MDSAWPRHGTDRRASAPSPRSIVRHELDPQIALEQRRHGRQRQRRSPLHGALDRLHDRIVAVAAGPRNVDDVAARNLRHVDPAVESLLRARRPVPVLLDAVLSMRMYWSSRPDCRALSRSLLGRDSRSSSASSLRLLRAPPPPCACALPRRRLRSPLPRPCAAPPPRPCARPRPSPAFGLLPAPCARPRPSPCARLPAWPRARGLLRPCAPSASRPAARPWPWRSCSASAAPLRRFCAAPRLRPLRSASACSSRRCSPASRPRALLLLADRRGVDRRSPGSRRPPGPAGARKRDAERSAATIAACSSDGTTARPPNAG